MRVVSKGNVGTGIGQNPGNTGLRGFSARAAEVVSELVDLRKPDGHWLNDRRDARRNPLFRQTHFF